MMQNIKKIIIPCFIVLFTGLFGKLNAQESFYVYFMQNGKRINVKESKIELKKQAFEIRVEYTAPMDLIVHQSFDSKTWHAAEKGKLLYNIPVFNKTEKQKPTIFDFDGTLILNPEITFLWKKNQTDSTSDIKSKKGRKINIKKVKNLYSVPDSVNIYPPFFHKDLYLVFVNTIKDKTGDRIEIQRETVKINWVNKYKEETKSYERKKNVLAKENVRVAKQSLKRKQKSAKKEKQRLIKLEKEKQKRVQKEKKKKDRKSRRK